MGCLAEKGRGLLTFRAVRKATDPEEAQRLIADALPSVVASVLQPAELEAMHQRLKQLPEPPERAQSAQGRLAGCRRRFSPGIPVHVPGGDSVHFHAQRRAGPARLQRDRHRDVVLDRLCLRTRDRAPPVADGHFDGRSRVDSRRPDHGAGRMKQMRLIALIAIAVVFAGDNALAGDGDRRRARAVAEEADEKAWSFSASATTYIVPDDQDYVQPTFTADRGWLHLEARYNYENLETGSVWIGYNFSGGEKLEWEFTPMLGGVFGDTTGIAPGYKVSVSLVEARALQRRRIRLRHRQFGGELLLQLVRAEPLAGGLVSIRSGRPANAGLPDRRRYSARTPRGFLLQENGFHDLRIQSGPGINRRGSFLWVCQNFSACRFSSGRGGPIMHNVCQRLRWQRHHWVRV